MAGKVADFVHQTTMSTGTGALTLAVIAGKRAFGAAFPEAIADSFFYFISHRSAPEWEVGTGHIANDGRLVRDTALKSSNAGALVNFSDGKKDVVNDLPAARQQQATAYRQITAAGNVEVTAEDGVVGVNKTTGENTDVILTDEAAAEQIIITIKDEKPDAGTHRIRLQPETGTIEGQPYYDINTDRASVSTYHNRTEWKLL